MSYDPFFKSTEDNYEGAKYSTWIVHHEEDSLYRGSHATGGTDTTPTSDTSLRTPFRTNSGNIETLMDPFGDGIAVDSSNTERLKLPVGKYWLDWRISVYNGNSPYNWYLFFPTGMGGYLESSSAEKWIARGGASYMEESLRGYHKRSVCGYYESTSSDCYIVCIATRLWSTWSPGGTPTLNKDAASAFSTSTSFPHGESRLLVMRLE